MPHNYFPYVLTAIAAVLFAWKFLYEVINGSRGLPFRDQVGPCRVNELDATAKSHVELWTRVDAASFVAAVPNSERQLPLRAVSRVGPTGIRLHFTYGRVIETSHPACLAAFVLLLLCLIMAFFDFLRMVAGSQTILVSVFAIALSMMTTIYYVTLVVRWGFITEPAVLRDLFKLNV